jgi:hypothetical protein
VVQVTFDIDVPVAHIFYGWVDGLGSQFKLLVLVAIAALCWALWTSRNDIVFDNSLIQTYMQVMYQGTYWLRLWAQLQWHEGLAKQIVDVCGCMESTVMQIFTSYGWRFSYRIAAS